MAKNPDMRSRKMRLRKKRRKAVVESTPRDGASLTEYFLKYHQAPNPHDFMMKLSQSLGVKYGLEAGFHHYMRLGAAIEFLHEHAATLFAAGVVTSEVREDGAKYWDASEWTMQALATGGSYDRWGEFVFDVDAIVREAVRLHQEHSEPVMNATPVTIAGGEPQGR